MVEHKKTKKLYALKYIDKAKCIKQKAVANIIQERRLLEEVCTLPQTEHTAFPPSRILFATSSTALYSTTCVVPRVGRPRSERVVPSCGTSPCLDRWMDGTRRRSMRTRDHDGPVSLA